MDNYKGNLWLSLDLLLMGIMSGRDSNCVFSEMILSTPKFVSTH